MKPSETRTQVTRRQQIKSFLADIEIPLVVALGLLGLTFSTLGFRQYYQSLQLPYTWGDCIFQAVQLLSLILVPFRRMRPCHGCYKLAVSLPHSMDFMPLSRPWRPSFWINGIWLAFVFIETTGLFAGWGAKAVACPPIAPAKSTHCGYRT